MHSAVKAYAYLTTAISAHFLSRQSARSDSGSRFAVSSILSGTLRCSSSCSERSRVQRSGNCRHGPPGPLKEDRIAMPITKGLALLYTTRFRRPPHMRGQASAILLIDRQQRRRAPLQRRLRNQVSFSVGDADSGTTTHVLSLLCALVLCAAAFAFCLTRPHFSLFRSLFHFFAPLSSPPATPTLLRI